MQSRSADAVVLVVVVVLVAVTGAGWACLVPPGGCEEAVCSRYATVTIPGGGDYGSNSTLWKGENDKLAFIRSAFNKNLATLGPSSFDVPGGAARWLALPHSFKGYGPGKLPSLNFDFYEVDGATRKTLASPVPGVPNPHGNLASCCHACRLTLDCPLFLYVPAAYSGGSRVAGGKCFFVHSGGSKRDGPFDWVDPSNARSPRTLNLGSPAALSKARMQARYSQGQLGLNSSFPWPTFALVFLGGYCNNHAFPNGSVTDDPHFVGAHGTRFDFNGALDRSFCLLTDSRLHLNVLLQGYSVNASQPSNASHESPLRSWIREVGLMWTPLSSPAHSHSLRLVARPGKLASRLPGPGFLALAELDGTAVAVPREAGGRWEAGEVALTNLGPSRKGWYDVESFRVQVGAQLDLTLTLRPAHPRLRTPDDAHVHFNLAFNHVAVTPKVHGVLGQTYRDTPSQRAKALHFSLQSRLLRRPIAADGPSGSGFLDGSVADYQTSNLLRTDCRVSAFAL